MKGVRNSWAEMVGKPSELVVELDVEFSVPRSTDSPCSVRGCVGVPSPARTDPERYYLASVLVAQTVLPQLRPEAQLRIRNMTTRRLAARDQKKTVEVKENGLSMPRFMWWEKEYVERPYMRALPMKDLNQRFFEIVMNSHEISKGGKLGIRVATNGVEWMRYFGHITTEACARELPYPLFLDKRVSPDYDGDNFYAAVKGKHADRAYNAVEACLTRVDTDFHVVKYGERGHMEDFLAHGEMLVSPSARFEDKAFGQAVRYDENTVSFFGARTSDGRVIPANDLPSWWGDRYSMIDFKWSMDRSYMMYCLAGSLSATLFSQFGRTYDSCVLIHDMDEFVQRVVAGARRHFPVSEFVHGRGPVTYVDPLSAIEPIPDVTTGTPVTIPFLKHFKHAYQQEFRFVWVPKVARTDLQNTCLRVGSIEDIAELITV